jgi:hypothetical protein
MSLALFFDGKLLTYGHSSESVVITLTSGTKVPVTLRRRFIPPAERRRGSTGSRVVEEHFIVLLASLPGDAQKWVRATANKVQRKKYDRAPEYVYPQGHGLIPPPGRRRVIRAVKADKPPKTIKLPGDLKVNIKRNSSYQQHDALEVDKSLVVKYDDPFLRAHEFTVGTIKSFELKP